MRVALIKTGALGDVVRTLALPPALRRRFPALDLTWITAPGVLDVVTGHPDVARVVTSGDPPDAPWRRERYDWVISLDDDPVECRLAATLEADRLSGAYLGSDGHRHYTPDTAPWFGMGILRPEPLGGLARANELKRENTRTVATILYECLGLPLPLLRPSLAVPDGHVETARTWLRKAGLGRAPLVGLNTGAGGRWRFKSWGVDQTAALAQRLHDELDAGVVVLGGPAESARNREVAEAAARPGVVEGPTDLDLLGFTALVGACEVLVTSDSLALHLGVSQGRPVVAFFGPTSAAEIDLYGLGEKVVTPLPCRCCYLTDCDVRPHCMASLAVDDLFRAARRWLG